MAQQRSTALVTAVTKLIDISSPPSPPSLFTNPQPSSIKSKLETVHNDNLASLLQIDQSSHDFHLEMRIIDKQFDIIDKQTNFAFTSLIPTSSGTNRGRLTVHVMPSFSHHRRFGTAVLSHFNCKLRTTESLQQQSAQTESIDLLLFLQATFVPFFILALL
jgi:hypothetical protein